MSDAESLLGILMDGSADEKSNALERMRRLAKQSDGTRAEIVELGTLDTLRRLLCETGGKVKERSVILLVYLAKTEANRDAIRESGCMEILCQELASDSSVVLHNCMAALVNLTISNTANQNLLRESGHMKTVVRLMKAESSKTRHNACWLLKKLATNNQKNRDKLRELGALENLVPLLSKSETSEVQEHAAALLAFLLDKHTRNRMQFKDIPGGPGALAALHDTVLGSGSKTEDFCAKCIESLGGAKKLMDESSSSHHHSSNSRGSGNGSRSSSSTLKPPSSSHEEKIVSPRREARSPRVAQESPRGRMASPRSKVMGIFRKKEEKRDDKWGDDDDPIMKPGGDRRSMDEEELEKM